MISGWPCLDLDWHCCACWGTAPRSICRDCVRSGVDIKFLTPHALFTWYSPSRMRCASMLERSRSASSAFSQLGTASMVARAMWNRSFMRACRLGGAGQQESGGELIRWCRLRRGGQCCPASTGGSLVVSTAYPLLPVLCPTSVAFSASIFWLSMAAPSMPSSPYRNWMTSPTALRTVPSYLIKTACKGFRGQIFVADCCLMADDCYKFRA
jgi:hypothetical protein